MFGSCQTAGRKLLRTVLESLYIRSLSLVRGINVQAAIMPVRGRKVLTTADLISVGSLGLTSPCS